MKLAIDFRLIINILKLNILKKYLGEIFLTVGSGLTIYNLTGFTHQATRFYTPPKPSAVNVSYWQGNYYFTDGQRAMIALGVMLIIAGVMIMKRRKNSGQLSNF